MKPLRPLNENTPPDVDASSKTSTSPANPEEQTNCEVQQEAHNQAEFLAELSHKLRTPLTVMLGWAQLLRSRRLDERSTIRAAENIERSAKLQALAIEELVEELRSREQP
ncbi:HAMP domain-containing histidine kinase [Leptolyngbya sp. FACHB-261]|uniref:HAMP domain-containing histidine kinase n=1 Tax=Leptolyngbya sp. FACHB-261 TaxID=2692806 RepID=UPI00168243E1|nr:HAMP domain-containing histidine kinase [Leptolyngbya sp. FACHB-261]MBD2101187.1 HAMP domain-containing histidine kinase [Leptolyngbya sp. FACHB-261]